MFRIRWASNTNFPTAATIRMCVLPAGANRWRWPRTVNGANMERAVSLQNRRDVYGQTTINNPRVGCPVRADAEPNSRYRMERTSRAGSRHQDSLLFLRATMRNSAQGKGQSGHRL